MTRFSKPLAGAVLTSAEPIRFVSRHYEVGKSGCKDPAGCTTVEFDYVEAVSGPAVVRKRINAASRPDLADAKAFVAEYKNDRREFKGLPSEPWALSRSVKVLRATPPVISLQLLRGVL